VAHKVLDSSDEGDEGANAGVGGCEGMQGLEAGCGGLVQGGGGHDDTHGGGGNGGAYQGEVVSLLSSSSSEGEGRGIGVQRPRGRRLHQVQGGGTCVKTVDRMVKENGEALLVMGGLQGS